MSKKLKEYKKGGGGAVDEDSSFVENREPLRFKLPHKMELLHRKGVGGIINDGGKKLLPKQVTTSSQGEAASDQQKTGTMPIPKAKKASRWDQPLPLVSNQPQSVTKMSLNAYLTAPHTTDVNLLTGTSFTYSTAATKPFDHPLPVFSVPPPSLWGYPNPQGHGNYYSGIPPIEYLSKFPPPPLNQAVCRHQELSVVPAISPGPFLSAGSSSSEPNFEEINTNFILEASNWIEYFSNEHQLPYYYNVKTFQCVWHKPLALIQLGEMLKKRIPPKKTTAQRAFMAKKEKPTVAATVAATEDDNDANLGVTATQVPGTTWSLVTTKANGIFYHNCVTKESTWDRPSELKALYLDQLISEVKKKSEDQVVRHEEKIKKKLQKELEYKKQKVLGEMELQNAIFDEKIRKKVKRSLRAKRQRLDKKIARLTNQ